MTVLRVLERIERRPDYLIYAYNDEEFDEEHKRARDMLGYEATYRPRERANLALKIPVTNPFV